MRLKISEKRKKISESRLCLKEWRNENSKSGKRKRDERKKRLNTELFKRLKSKQELQEAIPFKCRKITSEQRILSILCLKLSLSMTQIIRMDFEIQHQYQISLQTKIMSL